MRVDVCVQIDFDLDAISVGYSFVRAAWRDCAMPKAQLRQAAEFDSIGRRNANHVRQQNDKTRQEERARTVPCESLEQ